MRHFLVLAVLLTASMGCGVSHEEHQALQAKLVASEASLKQSTSELTTARKEVSDLRLEVKRLRETPEAAWDELVAVKNTKNWHALITRAEALAERWPDSPQGTRARREVGAARNNLAKDLLEQARREISSGLPQAEGTLRRVIEQHPNSEYAAAARRELQTLTAKLAAAEREREKEREKERQELAKRNSQLELRAFSWSRGSGYATVEGQLKNLTGSAIDNIEAVAIFEDANGNFITSDSALIEYRPLLPGQSSPFKVMATWNPAMKRCRIEFKQLMGAELSVYHSWSR